MRLSLTSGVYSHDDTLSRIVLRPTLRVLRMQTPSGVGSRCITALARLAYGPVALARVAGAFHLGELRHDWKDACTVRLEIAIHVLGL